MEEADSAPNNNSGLLLAGALSLSRQDHLGVTTAIYSVQVLI